MKYLLQVYFRVRTWKYSVLAGFLIASESCSDAVGFNEHSAEVEFENERTHEFQFFNLNLNIGRARNRFTVAQRYWRKRGWEREWYAATAALLQWHGTRGARPRYDLGHFINTVETVLTVGTSSLGSRRKMTFACEGFVAKSQFVFEKAHCCESYCWHRSGFLSQIVVDRDNWVSNETFHLASDSIALPTLPGTCVL